jgi:hypothetical protein
MSNLMTLLHDGAVTATVTGASYTAVVTVTTLTAVLSRNADRRGDARRVLKILLRHRDQ